MRTMIKRVVRFARFVGGKAKFLCEMFDGSFVEKFISEIAAALRGEF